MIQRLSYRDILALGFMTFALFVGAGNIIFPPAVGLESGEHVWMAAFGFMITAVSLPIITIVALARVGGDINVLSSVVGNRIGVILSIICYVTVGPLFAIPRTATVSFETGIAPLTSNTSIPLFIYSIIYFSLVIIISFYPRKLLDTVGHFLAPLKIIALTILGISTFFLPAKNTLLPVKDAVLSTVDFHSSAFTNGFINGYLTMDTLGALVFGIVIVNAARSRGVEDEKLITRYTILSGIIAGIGLTLVYISLFKLGYNSRSLVAQGVNGTEILHAYIKHHFGIMGMLFLAGLIFLACIVTAVGLICACSQFFTRYVPLSYKTLVFTLSFFSMLISNLGLSHLIKISIPILTAIYPPCIVLVLLSFTLKFWHKNIRIIAPTMLVSLFFGIFDALKTTGMRNYLIHLTEHIPFLNKQITWLFPSLITMVITAAIDRIKGSEKTCIHQ